MKLEINLPDKVYLRDISIASCVPADQRKGLKAKLEREWKCVRRRFRPLVFPLTCEFCRHVGMPSWHCHNDHSPQYGINVHRNDTCPLWSPNAGLMMFLKWEKVWGEVAMAEGRKQ